MKKNQKLMSLPEFSSKYKFVSHSWATRAYKANEKPYRISMHWINNNWFINAKEFVYEMRKEYPQIDGKYGEKKFTAVAKNIQRYKNRYPKNPIFKDTPRRVNVNISVSKKINKQEFVKLTSFSNKYKFFSSRSAAIYAFERNDKPYISSMKKIDEIWHINIQKYLQEMCKKYPQIKDFTLNNEYLPMIARRIQQYLKKHPNSSLWTHLKSFENEVQKTPQNKKNISSKKKSLEPQLIIDSIFCYLLEAYLEESVDEFKITFHEAIEEYLEYLLKEKDRRSA